jgi:multiple sugar transport system permease protein
MSTLTTSIPGLHRKSRLSLGQLLAWAVLLGMLTVTLMPLWVVIKTALMAPGELYTQSTQLLPSDPTLGNSLMFTGIVVTIQIACAAMAAYAFARLRFPGRNVIFGLFLASMMVPGVVTFIPNFILIKDLGLLNTMAGMVAPFCLMQGFSIFFLRQFFLSIPKDLEEAALLDGASHLYIFFRVVLPLSVTPIVTIAMLTGINMWNEFFWPFLVSKDEAMQVLPVALQSFKSQTPQGQPDWTGLMAATAITVLPTVVLLVTFSRRVVESVQFSGGK